MVYETGSFTFAPGDMLFMYTDGTIEARDRTGAFFGEQRLRDLLLSVSGEGCIGYLRQVLGELDRLYRIGFGRRYRVGVPLSFCGVGPKQRRWAGLNPHGCGNACIEQALLGNHGRMNEWNDIAVLTPPGDIDIATVPSLRRRLDALIDRGVRRVVINCQAVSFIDSTGLAFLLTRARELMRREGLLSLVNASGEVVRFWRLLVLSIFFMSRGRHGSRLPPFRWGVAALE